MKGIKDDPRDEETDRVHGWTLNIVKMLILPKLIQITFTPIRITTENVTKSTSWI